MSEGKRNRHDLQGILLLNKPIGLSSNQALQKVKYLLNARKAGHTGSLDPLASGMLPICFGEATKFSRFLLNADKRYLVTAKLGERTTTSDAEGEVISRRQVCAAEQQIKQALQQFTGQITQIPSMYSAIKHKGQPLYKLARQGIEVERKARTIRVYSLEFIRYQAGLLELAIFCSKGTYVRTLIDDLGEQLGCGAHVASLHRLTVGPYLPEQMSTLADIEVVALQCEQTPQSLLLPVDSSITDWPPLTIPRLSAYYLLRGQAVQVPGMPDAGAWVRLLLQDGQFIGVGEVQDDGRVAPKRLVAATAATI